jgi:Uma2 family endonuclease
MSVEPRRKLDYSYILRTPNDGNRYELVDGELFVNPAPSRIHQRVSRRLQRQLEDYFHDRKLGEVFNAPLDVILTPHDVFGPDLLVVGDPAHTTTRSIEKPPLLVVETLSPSTRKVE